MQALFKSITILSLEQATVLPYLTFRLVQDGCRVVRLEHPVLGDPNRLIGQNRLGEERMNTYYLCINAGKEALTLNLASAEGQNLLKRLLVELPVDVFAINQMPRNYRKLGIDYESLKAVKPDLIWLGVTGFGPEIDEAAYDPVLQARAGLMDLTGEPGGSPQVLGIPLPDMGAAEHAYGQVMKALFVRAGTGRGSRIDLSMLQSTASWLAVPVTQARTFGRKMTRRGNVHEFFAPVSVYQTKDGYVYLAVGNDKQWANLVKLAGFESLDDPAYARNAGRIKDVVELNRKIAALIESWTTEEIAATFKAAGLAVARINSVDQAAEDPLIAPRLLHSGDPRTGLELTLAPPPLDTDFLDSVNRRLSFPPRLGEHNQAVYGGVLGLSDQTLADYRARGII